MDCLPWTSLDSMWTISKNLIFQQLFWSMIPFDTVILILSPMNRVRYTWVHQTPISVVTLSEMIPTTTTTTPTTAFLEEDTTDILTMNSDESDDDNLVFYVNNVNNNINNPIKSIPKYVYEGECDCCVYKYERVAWPFEWLLLLQLRVVLFSHKPFQKNKASSDEYFSDSTSIFSGCALHRTLPITE